MKLLVTPTKPSWEKMERVFWQVAIMLLIMPVFIMMPWRAYITRTEGTIQLSSSLDRGKGRIHENPADKWKDEIPWNLQVIDVPSAWELSMGHPEIVVAVLDTGVDLSHPDLQGSFWVNSDEIPDNGIDDDGNGYVDDIRGWDFQDDDNVPQDEHGHGTFVAGIIAARANDFGLIGVAPNVSLMPIRILNSQGILTSNQWDLLVKGIDYAVENGARVIVLSIEALITPPKAVHDALKRAREVGVLVMCPTGNDGNSQIAYPGAYPEVLAISAIDINGAVPRYVNHGNGTHVTAPGDDINSTWLAGSYRINSGTSFAVPHVAGVAALIWSLNPSLSADEVWMLLTNTTTPLTQKVWDPKVGFGLINASRAVRSAIDHQSPQLDAVEVVGIRNDFFSGDKFLINALVTDDVAVLQVNLEYSFDNSNWHQLSGVALNKPPRANIVFEVEVNSFKDMLKVKLSARDARGNWNHSGVLDLTESARQHLSNLSSLSVVEAMLIVGSMVGTFAILVITVIRMRRWRSER